MVTICSIRKDGASLIIKLLLISLNIMYHSPFWPWIVPLRNVGIRPDGMYDPF